MLVAASLLTTLLLALAIAIAANPVLEGNSYVRFPLTRRRTLANYNVVVHDRSRLNSLTRRHTRRRNWNDRESHLSSTSNSTTKANFGGTLYTARISVGYPSTIYNLQLDSGSGNTWVWANSAKPYVVTSTSQPTNNTVDVGYGSGHFRGNEYIDQINIGSKAGLIIHKQSIGVVSPSGANGSDGIDGILGIGPTDLTIGTLFPDNTSSIPTVTDNLFISGAIPKRLVAVFFQPYNSSNPDRTFDGELTWGRTEASLFIGNITFAPITSHSPANTYWAIDASLTYGLNALLHNAVSMIDTATTLVLVNSKAFTVYKKSTGAVFDNQTKLLTITTSKFKKLENLNFGISGSNFTLSADAQIWPRKLNNIIGGVASKIYLIVGEIGQENPIFDIILGMAALERFYCVFDTGNNRVGFAKTTLTYAKINNHTNSGD